MNGKPYVLCLLFLHEVAHVALKEQSGTREQGFSLLRPGHAPGSLSVSWDHLLHWGITYF